MLWRLQAFILFKTTDSTNHAFDWTNLPGSGGGIISSVKWFSRHSTPELWNKTNQENHHFDFDQSAKAKLWISRDETPGANQDRGIDHIIRTVHRVTYWYSMLIAYKMSAQNDTALKIRRVLIHVFWGKVAQKVCTLEINARENTAHII